MSDSVTLFVQVHLAMTADQYSKAPGDTIVEKVNKNLFFDLSHSHLYITTEKKVCLSGLLCYTSYTCMRVMAALDARDTGCAAT